MYKTHLYVCFLYQKIFKLVHYIWYTLIDPRDKTFAEVPWCDINLALGLVQGQICCHGRDHNFLKSVDYKNQWVPRLCTGTGKSTWVSKICSPRRGLPSRGRCKSLTRGWISLSLYKVVVDYFSPTALNPHNKTPLFALKTTSKRFLFRKGANLG